MCPASIVRKPLRTDTYLAHSRAIPQGWASFLLTAHPLTRQRAHDHTRSTMYPEKTTRTRPCSGIGASLGARALCALLGRAPLLTSLRASLGRFKRSLASTSGTAYGRKPAPTSMLDARSFMISTLRSQVGFATAVAHARLRLISRLELIGGSGRSAGRHVRICRVRLHFADRLRAGAGRRPRP